MHSTGIPLPHLYGFTLDEHIQCYRIHHPSSVYHRTKAAEVQIVLLEPLRVQLAARIQTESPSIAA